MRPEILTLWLSSNPWRFSTETPLLSWHLPARKASRDLDLWAYANGVTLDFSRPGKPADNAFIEAFNGRFRAECLKARWFMSLEDAREKVEDWRKYYNEVRPHGQSGGKSRSHCWITMAQPARYHDKARKLYLPGIQRMGSDH